MRTGSSPGGTALIVDQHCLVTVLQPRAEANPTLTTGLIADMAFAIGARVDAARGDVDLGALGRAIIDAAVPALQEFFARHRSAIAVLFLAFAALNRIPAVRLSGESCRQQERSYTRKLVTA